MMTMMMMIWLMGIYERSLFYGRLVRRGHKAVVNLPSKPMSSEYGSHFVTTENTFAFLKNLKNPVFLGPLWLKPRRL